MSPWAPPQCLPVELAVLPPSDDAHSLPPRRLLNLAFSPCEDRGTLPVLSLSPGHHFDNAVGFSPHDSQAGKGLCGGGEILVFIFVFLFSLNQHKINREDNWRAFKLVCDQGGLFPPQQQSWSCDPGSLGESSTTSVQTWQYVCSHSFSLFSSPSDTKAASSSADSWLWLAGSGGAAGGNQALPFLG